MARPWVQGLLPVELGVWSGCLGLATGSTFLSMARYPVSCVLFLSRSLLFLLLDLLA